MNILRVVLFLLLPFIAPAQTLRISNVNIYDGNGGQPYKGEVRISGDKIVAVGAKLAAEKGEAVHDGNGMALAPGFFDMHSHADRGILEQSHDNVVRQGITTVLVGQDGDSEYPLKDFFAKLDGKLQMNLASMAGHATLREQVMGKDLFRAATPEEIDKMFTLMHYEMQAGAMGLSTGLEYEEAHFATTDEVVKLAQMAAGHGGFYISHVRDEGNDVFKSFDEIIEIGKRAKLPVEITHIKLGTVPVWHLAAKKMPEYFARAAREGVDLKADVYPYTYWQSTLRVIVPDRDYYNKEKATAAIADTGGAERIHITQYAPEPDIAGLTLAQAAAKWKLSPVDAFMRYVKATAPDGDFKGADDDVIGESMSEDDLEWFAAQPRIMFCTDGELHGKHPRGAGSFPRALGYLVREKKVAPLEDVVRRMTSLPAAQLGLKDRGKITVGFKADLVLFDPATIIDKATMENPEVPPVGMMGVMVNGKWVVDEGKVTGMKPGVVLKRQKLEEQKAASEQ